MEGLKKPIEVYQGWEDGMVRYAMARSMRAMVMGGVGRWRAAAATATARATTAGK